MLSELIKVLRNSLISKYLLQSNFLQVTWYILVVSRALVICPDIYTGALEPNSPWAWVYISGKSLVPMIQLLIVLYKEEHMLYFFASPL